MNRPRRTGLRPRTARAAQRTMSGPTTEFPMICDLTCPHADFAPASAVGACRRDQAIWCVHFGRLNNKHTRCLGRKG
jgi:hypothetical protein